MFGLSMNMTTLLPIAIFGAFACGVFYLLDLMIGRKPRAEERLDVLKNPRRSKLEQQGKGAKDAASDAMTNLLEKATPTFAKALKPKTEKEESGIKLSLSYAGFRRESAVQIYLGLKIIMMAIGLILGGGTCLFIYGFSKDAVLRLIAVGGVMFYLPNIGLWFLAKKRKQAIFLSLPDTLDLMVVCVEAGLGLDQAMRRVCDEMQRTYKVICDELSICNFQLQMGRARNEVLHELGQRTGVDDLRALASILIQADKFGSSVGKALRVQSDSMRTRRSQLAEEKAAKTAVQLIFPLVLFIFPGIFVVLVGPAAITMVRQMFPMMQGAG